MDLELKDGLPVLSFETTAAFSEWIEAHISDVGLWLKIAKKGSGRVTISYAEGLDVALCYGWIDGQKQTYDEQYFLQRFTPRRAKSVWSKINVAKIAELEKAGRMKPAGLAAVDAAKADGRWDAAYAGPATMTMPEDFAAALEANTKAKAFWATLNKANTFAFNYRIRGTKNPELRKSKIEKFVAMLSEEIKIHG
ncbi:YdeI/OmpD-associated family protein [Daejeonella lutea]|uniref:Uncharacterized conserved protein YdeI, YjbR/CyaY-like superfamily, DUF1801 family n=1 Tax=Daejeonella lutea TaxID=572036 RepID=A0A1T5AF04_9SPHI|nr:YdeI/OmpD-associated family protein [Daejeonella lutea]SKB33506.1 Uncharacterized conserved protein YdeI, YjbR/CyaY-like superfamily, DUF1801 family [Daejeonella lutea]